MANGDDGSDDKPDTSRNLGPWRWARASHGVPVYLPACSATLYCLVTGESVCEQLAYWAYLNADRLRIEPNYNAVNTTLQVTVLIVSLLRMITVGMCVFSASVTQSLLPCSIAGI